MNNIANQNILFLAPLGSEIRQFGHSGLFGFLIDNGQGVYVAAKNLDDDLLSQLDSRVVPCLLPFVPRPFFLEQIEIVLDKAHLIREVRCGNSGWQYQANKPKNFKQTLLFNLQNISARVLSGYYPVYRFFLFLERLLQCSFVSAEWMALLRETSPAIVVTNVPKVNRILPGLAAAKAAGCITLVLYHTWKDISAAGRLNHDFSAIGVWNEEMKSELLRQNPHVDPETVKIVGCAHFDCVGRKDWLLPEHEFRAALGVSPSARLLLYPASAPWVVPDEERFIAHLWMAIKAGHFGRDAQLIVRLNPMDDTGDLASTLQKNSSDIIVTRPDWRWDKRANWCFQRKSDVLFYNSLLEYSSVCVGIPSTVTVECAVANLPVVNIGFESDGPPPLNGTVRSFWEADFYKDVRESGAASLATSADEMLAMVNCALQDRNWLKPQREALLRRQLGVPPHRSADVTKQLIDDLVNSRRVQNSK